MQLVKILFCASMCLGLTGCFENDFNKDQLIGAGIGATVTGGAAKLLGADMFTSVLLGLGGGLVGYWIADKSDKDSDSGTTMKNSANKVMEKIGFKS